MGSQTKGKLNWLQHTLPEGLVVDAGWLEQHGISRQLRRKYVMHRLAAFSGTRRLLQAGSSQDARPLPWQQLVISLNALLSVPVAVGARTALELQGFSHYLAASGSREAHLYSNEDLPGWVLRLPVSTRLVFHSAVKLFKHGAIPPYDSETAHRDFRAGRFKPRTAAVGTLELAAGRVHARARDPRTARRGSEARDLSSGGCPHGGPAQPQPAPASDAAGRLPEREGEAAVLLVRRTPQSRLAARSSTTPKIDLGKGKRMLVHGGKLDPKYNITVPENLDGAI